MKILFLGGGSSIHTVRWVNALSDAGVEVVLATQHTPIELISAKVSVHQLPYSGSMGYFRNVPILKRILATERPDLLNSHYASGYGTTARLSGFAPTLLSVWGSDVYDFPERSMLHRWWVRGNLRAATRVASTSEAMAAQTKRLEPVLGEIAVTPFGVEMDRFVPDVQNYRSEDCPVTIGTVKALKGKYGIDTFLESIALLVKRLRQEGSPIVERLEVRIIGDGPMKEELEKLAADLGVGGVVRFIGRVNHTDVPAELRKLDIYVALSRRDSESFGVAIVEAGACQLPVVVSDAGGLPEVVADGHTGIVVPRENPTAAAEALYKLLVDPFLRRGMGMAGRERVVELYDWQKNVKTMIDLYEQVVADWRKSK